MPLDERRHNSKRDHMIPVLIVTTLVSILLVYIVAARRGDRLSGESGWVTLAPQGITQCHCDLDYPGGAYPLYPLDHQGHSQAACVFLGHVGLEDICRVSRAA